MALTEDEENFLRFFKIVSGPATQALKAKLDECFPQSQLRNKLQNEEEKLKHLYRVGQLNREDFSLLFCTSDSLCSDKFDVNLIISLLRNFANIEPPSLGYDNLPPTTEISTGADLARIIYYKNIVSHSFPNTFRTQYFNGIWNDLTGAVVRLGGTQYTSKCEGLRKENINQDLVVEIQSELQAYKDNMQRHFLTTTVRDVHTVLTKLVNGILKSHYEGNFIKFLSDRKHYFYHHWDHTLCCACPSNKREISNNGHMENGLFTKLYKFSKDDERTEHVKIENGNAIQRCIHSYIPKNIPIEDLEISSLCYLLLHSATLSPNDQHLVSFIKRCERKLIDCLFSMSTLPDIDWFELRITIDNIELMLGRLSINNACVPKSRDISRKRNRSGDDPFTEMMHRSYSSSECSYKEDRESSKQYGTSMQQRPKTMHIDMYKTKQKINKLTMQIIFEKFHKYAEHIEGNQVTTVCWRIETNNNWNVMKIIDKLQKAREQISEEQKVKITEVVIGSINIITLVPNDILYETQKCDTSIRNFLKKVVEVGEIETSKSAKINVVAKIIPPNSLRSLNIKFGMTISMTDSPDESYNCIVDKRLERNFTRSGEPYIGLYDGMFVDCIVDKRLEINGSSTGKQKSTLGYPESAILTIHRNRVCTDNMNWMYNFKCSIMDSDEALICRYFLANNIFKNDISTLLSALQFAIKMQSVMCAKAIAWKITKMFVKSIRTDFLDVWPGFLCLCKMKSEQEVPKKAVFCSSKVVIVVEMRTDTDCSKLPSFFHKIPIIYKNKPGFSNEANMIGKEVDKIKAKDKDFVGKAKGITHLKAKEQFLHFSKLSLISPSPLKSKNYRTNQGSFPRTPCIQLYCREKGIIPVGECHFPCSISSFDTDVLEGYPEFLVHDIKIGSGIQTESSMGTLGGFVRYHGMNAFLTCAHVVLNRECLQSKAKRHEIHNNPIEIKCLNKQMPSDDIPCGYLVNHAFPPDAADGVSIDAAIVLLNPSAAKINHQDIICVEGGMRPFSDLGMKSPYLNDNCLDYKLIGTLRKLHVISAGAISSVQEVTSNIHIEEQHQAEFETLIHSVEQMCVSSDILDSVHLRTALDKVEQNELKYPRICTLYNQISLRNLIFLQGDSGTCIYVKDESGLTGCIGMAIAAHPDGGCIITPMTAILSYFKII